MGSRRGVAAVLAAVALCAGASASAASTVPRPDLVVSRGALGVTRTAHVDGRFVVANRGRARARRFTVALSVRAGARWRLVRRYTVAPLRRGRARTVKVAAALPVGLPVGRLALRVCADNGGRLRERSERNNCRTLGSVTVRASAGAGASGTRPTPAAAGTITTTPGGGDAPPPRSSSSLDPAGGDDAPPASGDPAAGPPEWPASTVLADPVAYTPDVRFELPGYWAEVPPGYDATHQTPTALLVWLHGCARSSEDDVDAVSARHGDRTYITIAPDQRENDCWYPSLPSDRDAVLDAIADAETHFNIDPRRVVIGGYSSGGDLAYRLAFDHAYTFAGVLAVNTSPFIGTGSTQQALLAEAAWSFHVVHVAHLDDVAYPIAGVRQEIGALQAAGFDVTYAERPGDHFDDDTPTSGTYYDIRTLLLPHMDDGWLIP